MPTLYKSDNCRVVMYLDDHPPPHVHVKMRDGRDCTVDLVSFEIKGRIAEREVKDAINWIRLNQTMLFAEWQRNTHE